MVKPKVIIKEMPSENTLTRTEYKDLNLEQIQKDYLQPKQIEELGIMKGSKASSLAKKGVLKSRKFYNKLYIERNSLFEYLKQN